MNRLVLRGTVLIVVLLFTATAFSQIENPDPTGGGGLGSDCVYWYCHTRDDGSVVCFDTEWETGHYGLGCQVKCDGPGCWCEFENPCYEV